MSDDTEEGLNQNPVLRTLMLNLIDSGATAFLETGTLWGDTCLWIARRRSSLPIYTCDVNPKAIEIARKKFIGHKLIHLEQVSSETYIAQVADKLGNLPLFYLDAHWGEYWPILNELRAINSLFSRAYIVMHDFRVPDIPRMWCCHRYDTKVELDLDYIRKALDFSHTYRIFYPIRHIPGRAGFAVLFQNIDPPTNAEEFFATELIEGEIK